MCGETIAMGSLMVRRRLARSTLVVSALSWGLAPALYIGIPIFIPAVRIPAEI
jgi:hypothetical protein